MAGWAYMPPSIAGATTTGTVVARQAAVIESPAMPLAMAPSQWAVAGATTIPSTSFAALMWPIRPSSWRASTSASTGWRLNVSSVSGPMNAVAEGVIRTRTSAPSVWSMRSSSTAL